MATAANVQENNTPKTVTPAYIIIFDTYSFLIKGEIPL